MKIPIIATDGEMKAFQVETNKYRQTLIDFGFWEMYDEWMDLQLQEGAPAGPIITAAAQGFAIALAILIYRFPAAENASEEDIKAAVKKQFEQVFDTQCMSLAEARAAERLIKAGGGLQ